MLGSVPVVDQVDVTEVGVAVVVSRAEGVAGRVAGSRGTRLHVGVFVRAQNKAVLVHVVQTIVVALTFDEKTNKTTINIMGFNKQQTKHDQCNKTSGSGGLSTASLIMPLMHHA